MVQVKTNTSAIKVLAVEPSMFAFLNKKFQVDNGNDTVDEGGGGDTKKDDVESKPKIYLSNNFR